MLTAHDVLPRRARAARVWPEVLETAERVVVHSHRAVEQLVELGLGRERIARIPHPVFEGEPMPPAEGRTLLFFGLIRDYKGLDVLLRALPEIPDARLVVAGDPLDPVPESSAATRRLAAALHRAGRDPGADGRRPASSCSRTGVSTRPGCSRPRSDTVGPWS